MSNEEILANRIEKYLEGERNEPLLLSTDELMLCMLALKLQVIDSSSDGLYDDVCEWEKIDEEGYKNCKYNYDETMSDFFKYCPYCGKKIKVVK